MFHRISEGTVFYRISAFFVHLHAIECQVRQLFEHPKLSHSPYIYISHHRIYKLVGVLPMGQSPVLISTSVRPRSGFRGFGRCLRCFEKPWESQRIPMNHGICWGILGESMGIWIFFWPLQKMRHCQDQMVSFGFWMAQRQPLLHQFSGMFKLRLVKSTWISWIINDKKHRGLQVLPYAHMLGFSKTLPDWFHKTQAWVG